MSDQANGQLLKEIFAEVCDLPEEERASVLGLRCAQNAQLRSEIEALLAANDSAGRFMAEPRLRPEQLPGTSSGADGSSRHGIAAGPCPGDWIGRYKILA